MNAGLANLATLKGFLLAKRSQEDTDFDSKLLQIGRGVLTQFERFCNRQFARVVDAEFVVHANQDSLLVPRFPLATTNPIKSIALCTDFTTGYVTQTGVILTVNAEAGVITLTSRLGDEKAYVKATYTGGYWWDTNEPNEGAGSLPSGATEVPSDLVLAWLLQCEQVWKAKDRLGASLIGEKPNTGAIQLTDLDFTPTVRSTLDLYRRFALL